MIASKEDPLAAQPSITSIGLVGAGAMGRGIAQIALTAGLKVVLADARPEACEEARSFILKMLERKVEKGSISVEELRQAENHLQLIALDDLDAFAECDLVIEAIVEKLDIKQELFKRLESVVKRETLLATNTSSLSVTAIASICRHPERVAGLHFFNPVPLMKVVEVIQGQLTQVDVISRLQQLVETLGHQPVVVADMPGFLVNHAGRGYSTEALRILSEGIAGIEDIDRVLRDQCGFRMGPFELFDLTGLDVSHPVTESIYQQFYQDPRYRPSPITAQRLKAGLLGKKTGQGFYSYQEGKQQLSQETPAPAAEAVPVWISPEVPQGFQRLVEILRGGSARLERGQPSEDALCLVTPLGEDATTAALQQGLDPRRTLAVDTLFAMDKRRVLMSTPVTMKLYRDRAWALLAEDATPVTIIQDSPGFIAQRMLACIINIGCELAQLQIASPKDIDIAVRAGLGYPQGPLEWADQLGPALVLELLEKLQKSYGDPRYRPSRWLQRRALLGVSTATEPTC